LAEIRLLKYLKHEVHFEEKLKFHLRENLPLLKVKIEVELLINAHLPSTTFPYS